jgi:hypothetical protein
MTTEDDIHFFTFLYIKAHFDSSIRATPNSVLARDAATENGIYCSNQTDLHCCGTDSNVVHIVNAPLVRRPQQPVDCIYRPVI